MAQYSLFPSIEVTSTTTSTGNFTTSATAGKGRQPLSARYSTGDRFLYRIEHETEDEWEIGIATLVGATEFSRSVRYSSNSDALVNFGAGTKKVAVTQIAIYDSPYFVPKGADVSDATQALTWSATTSRREIPVVTANRQITLNDDGMTAAEHGMVWRFEVTRTNAFTIEFIDEASSNSLFTLPVSVRRMLDFYWDNDAGEWKFSGQLPLG